MSMAVTESIEASSSAVADDWETGEVQQEEQLKNKQQQIRILKREKADREAAQKEQLSFPVGATPAPTMAVPSEAKPIPTAPRKLLRRPASGPNVAAAAVSAAAPAASAAVDTAAPTEEPTIESAQKGEISAEEEEKFKNLEKRKAVYDAARSRILGTDYKFEEVKASVNTSCRSRSPEIALQQRMAVQPQQLQQTQQGMNMMPPVNLSHPPPPLPPPHIVAAYQHLLMSQQQQYFTPQSGYPMGIQQQQQMGVGVTVPSTSANQGYRDLFDSAGGLYSAPPPQQTAAEALAAAARIRPQPLATMSLMSASLPPPNGINGMMYGGAPQAIGTYGRPPPSMFQNPDITFRHVQEPASRGGGGRRKKH
ncbi:hypothetical protein PFISCL1PPCAC_6489 [Pristionchus fissidentatus]|uniref:SUZ domain-containing protein n=1 Tax=Pristionchus fissidentatus TaxID=1538716 RepID=A0AAV5VAD3_9BILA|nr:hypothetical protein PFISCL1PPCAC_6489 [Pristionchus fissidentatus]